VGNDLRNVPGFGKYSKFGLNWDISFLTPHPRFDMIDGTLEHVFYGVPRGGR
jgi:hypothetical protein